ncbi:MAG: sugar phosphate isomerase/epimerase [Chloroflexota bacterium]|nr:MAG: sugar phosphate isomerase/epimerase [Chloroflexota bacterium]
MRLGLTSSAYQYLFAGAGTMFGDRTDLSWMAKGNPSPYYTRTPVNIDANEMVEWLINRCEQLGLPVCHSPIRFWDDQARVDRVKAMLTSKKIELMPSVSADLIAGGDKTKATVETAIQNIERYRTFGDVRVSKFCTTPMIHTRFTTEPPLDEQLARITEHIRPIVQAAESAKLVLAFENHLDYRVKEIVRVLDAIDSPSLRLLFDTGNTLTVCEDPIDAAYDGAKYTALVHLKDLKVHPWTPGREFVSVMYAAPLGRGHVDNTKILEILRERTPNANDLCLSLELMPLPPNEDEDLWVEESITYAKAAFAEFLH